MNILKKRGFTTLECMVSMVILSIIAYMITFSINNSFSLLDKNEEHLEMLNLAQNYLNETKYDDKNKFGTCLVVPSQYGFPTFVYCFICKSSNFKIEND